MSYDLEVRSDDRYSQSVPKSLVLEHLHALGARPTSSEDFLLYGDTESGQRIEIDLGREGGDEGHEVHYVGLGVPYAFLSATGSRVLDIAFGIAARLQWRVYDPQAGRYIGEAATEGADADRVQVRAAGQLADTRAKAGEEPLGRCAKANTTRARPPSHTPPPPQTKYMIAVASTSLRVDQRIRWPRDWTAGVEDPRPYVGRVLAVAGLDHSSTTNPPGAATAK